CRGTWRVASQVSILSILKSCQIFVLYGNPTSPFISPVKMHTNHFKISMKNSFFTQIHYVQSAALAFRLPLAAALFILSLFPLPAGAQNLAWVQQAGGTGFQETRNMAIDPEGNVFVIGTFEGAAVFGSGATNLNGAGLFNVFFAKYDASGNLLWVKGIGGTGGVDSGYGIALDAGGNICIAGNFTGTADFDPGPGVANRTSLGSFDAFLAKYNADGNLLWAHNFGGTQFDEAYCVAVDGAGNIALSGTFGGTADFDPGPANTAFESAGSNDIFFAKYTPSGNLLWARQLEGDGTDRVLSMALGRQNHLYLSGHFEGTVDFDPSGATGNRSAAGDSDLFFARYDGDGNLVWAKSVDGFSYEEARGIAVDRFDNVYITGRYAEPIDFDPGPGVRELNPAGINDAFFAKYDADGDLVWANSISGENNEMGNSIAVDTLGQVYVTGHFINTVDFDPDAATHTLTGLGDFDIFLAQYDASGHFLSAKSIGGMQKEESTVVALDAWQNIYVAGFFKGTADFDPGPDVTNLSSAGKDDGFIAKYTAPVTATHDVPQLNARVYPVPTAGVLHIALPGHTGEVHCAVFDLAGRMMLEQQGEGENLSVDLSKVVSGVYYLRIWSALGVKGVTVEVVP
ncbi:MAG TPA: SBBP repeat-containing protein, partial [Saprospiraceae bacterium]|nr:SBBP repeat-containing protein [Saprospiraceae bacterium]